MEREDIIEKFSEFLNEFYMNELVTALTETKKSISIDFSLLDKFDVELADCIFEMPDEVIEAAEEAVKQIDTGLAEAKLRVRFFNLPTSKEIRFSNGLPASMLLHHPFIQYAPVPVISETGIILIRHCIR